MRSSNPVSLGFARCLPVLLGLVCGVGTAEAHPGHTLSCTHQAFERLFAADFEPHRSCEFTVRERNASLDFQFRVEPALPSPGDA